MRRVVASSLVLVIGFALALELGCEARGQQAADPSGSAVSVATEAGRPRVFITDSTSWETSGSVGGGSAAGTGGFAGSSSGGARPQTAEVVKTFGQRCPEVIINNRPEASDYVVELDHEGGKSVLAHKDKVAVFVRKSGDSIFSKSTLSIGGSVKDACAAVATHWSAHRSELRATAPGMATSASVAPTAAEASSIRVDADVPNCDIEVDGHFMGSTPSSINLVPGEHQMVVKKSGYRDWTRSMMVGSGSVRLSAEMVRP